MKKLLFIALLFPFMSRAMELVYSLKMPQPSSHYFEVSIDVKNATAAEIEFKMPVWTPGSYLVREFSKNLNQVSALDKAGKPLQVVKKSKNAWLVQAKGASEFTVSYEVYAAELSVRTPFLDETHGFVAGAGVFMYSEASKNQKGALKIYPHASFSTISTALAPADYKSVPGCYTYIFSNYDQLVDSPIEIGNQRVFEFMAAGVRHTVAMYGEANYNVTQLQKDMAKVVETETAIFGTNPNQNYTFIIHNVVHGQGGLEHLNSCVLSVNRWSYAGSEYLGFINLVAHEYFHLWNVKRIRPIELGPFNYDQECYTSLLWVMEGITSYYDELVLLRSGFYTKAQFISKLQSQINYVEGTPGSRVQPVAHASFDAWIKAYRPNENSSNTTMTYYSRGAVLGAVLDAYIIQKKGGKQGLDQFLKSLYDTYAVNLGRGFTEEEFATALSEFLGEEMQPFLDAYVNGTQVIPYATYLGPVGIEVKDLTTESPSIGASFSDEGGIVVVKSVRRGSAAELAGLSVGDEVLACNGYRVHKAMLESMLNSLAKGESTELVVAREEKIRSIDFKMTSYSKPQFSLAPSGQHEALYNYWLR
ncbi:MAG: hypothetical protein RLZZ301_308 [Bacteroidota bacterium]|jgi:predicted metalloprotease with PDZ domain